MQSTKDELRKKELNRFANEYKLEEDRYSKEQTHWFFYSIGTAGALLGSAFLTAIKVLPHNDTYPEPEVIFLNLVLLTLFVYAMRQHSHLADLREDYANRKALAQSYQYMVEDDDSGALSEIQHIFFEKAIDVFTKRPKSRGNDVTWYQTLFAKWVGPKT